MSTRGSQTHHGRTEALRKDEMPKVDDTALWSILCITVRPALGAILLEDVHDVGGVGFGPL